MHPKPGDFFVSTSNTGPWYKRSLPLLVRYVTDSKFNHAGVFVGRVDHLGTDETEYVIEAQPGGVRFWPVEDYLGDNTVWSQGKFIPNDPRLDGNVRPKIVAAALDLLGTPYGVLDCVALAFAQKRLGSRADVKKALKDQPWWVRRLMSEDTVICSQVVDRCYKAAGITLFDDGRLGDWVSPGDLGRLLQA
jgi:hypothetical protein